MNEPAIYGAMGMTQRAGKCVSGDYATEKAVKGGHAYVAVLDDDASAATKARYAGYCQRADIPLLIMKDMGRAIGKPGRMTAAITDAGFARMIINANAKTDGGVS